MNSQTSALPSSSCSEEVTANYRGTSTLITGWQRHRISRRQPKESMSGPRKTTHTTFPWDVWAFRDNLFEAYKDSWCHITPDDPDDVVDAAIFNEEVQDFIKRKRAYKDNSTKFFNVIMVHWVFASNQVQSRGPRRLKDLKSKHDMFKLLKVESILHNQLHNYCHVGGTAYESVRALFIVGKQDMKRPQSIKIASRLL